MNARRWDPVMTRAREKFLGCVHEDKRNWPTPHTRTRASEIDVTLCVKLTTAILLVERPRPWPTGYSWLLINHRRRNTDIVALL